MRKLLVVLGIAFLLVAAGCETRNYTVVITNSSSKKVEYTYNGSSDSLEKDKSNTYEVLAYTPPPNITAPVDDETKKSTVKIEYDTTTGNYTFKDIE